MVHADHGAGARIAGILDDLSLLAAFIAPTHLGEGVATYRIGSALTATTGRGVLDGREVRLEVDGIVVLDVTVVGHLIRIRRFADGTWSRYVAALATQLRVAFSAERPERVLSRPSRVHPRPGRKMPTPEDGRAQAAGLRLLAAAVARRGAALGADPAILYHASERYAFTLALVGREVVLTIGGDARAGAVVILDRRQPHAVRSVTCTLPRSAIRALTTEFLRGRPDEDLAALTSYCRQAAQGA